MPFCDADRLFFEDAVIASFNFWCPGRMIVTVRLFTGYDRNDFPKTEITP
jgi:hypothetical protein